MYQRTHGRKFDAGDFRGKCIEELPIMLKSCKNIGHFTRRPDYGLLLFRAVRIAMGV